MNRTLEHILPKVQKPARYTGGEYNAIVKDRRTVDTRYALCFPDTYEIGMSNLGCRILYGLMNEVDGLWCERCYAPWGDMEDEMRREGLLLYGLESGDPISDFDIIGFSLGYEMAYSNVLNMLDLAGLPLRSADRPELTPLIVAGGTCAYNPEPLAPFVDLFVVGEGEEVTLEYIQLYRQAREECWSKEEFLQEAAQIPGIYVPAFYEPVYREDGTLEEMRIREGSGAPEKVRKRVVENMDGAYFPVKTIIPSTEIVHDRVMLELFRGCIRGCRFCQAGMTYRPVRERSADQVVSAVTGGLAHMGYDEVSLNSLSTTDHSKCAEMLNRLNKRLGDTGISISVPSQRLDSFGVDMAAAVAGEKKGGLTFAPEAGSQRMRDIINKNVTEEDLERATRAAFEAGWRRVKLYFMMGLPGETDEDIVAIAQLADHTLEIAREVVPKEQRGGISVSISVSVFIPKAHTPFQWCPQLDDAEVKRRQQLLFHSVKNRAVRIHCHDAATSLVEAVMSRGGRDIAPLIEGAWRRGQRFDAWTEQFELSRWEEAATELGMDLRALAQESFELDWRLPWEHVSPGVSRGFLLREYRRSLEGVTTPDCTRESCTGCGVCPTLKADNVLVGERA